MNDRIIRVTVPRAIARETLEDPELLIATEVRDIVVWCPRNRVGGLWQQASATWTLIGPVTLPTFMTLLQQMAISIPDTPELQRWLDRIDQVLLTVSPARPRRDT